MKYIIAVIKPSKLNDVRRALSEIGVKGVTVSDVRGFGRQGGTTEQYRGTEFEVSFVAKVKIEIACNASAANDIVKAIQRSANTGQLGDGKVFIMDMQDVMRIRTGETGADAL
ncbi:MAG: P-II family nitrogen regulator [Proteobacteria bacterium]|nr:P-II family nitrogen regulator [Pseudomonadota bacterium]